jgi:hypothetical protein
MKRGLDLCGALAVVAVLGSLVLLCLPSGAHADQITFGVSNQNITFTGNGSGSVAVSIASLTGNAFFNSDPLGTYAFGATSFTAGPGVGGIYGTGANAESFTFTGGDGDTLSGTVHWTFLQDSTANPKFFGTLTITSAAGDAAFLSGFHAGSTVDIDFISGVLSGSSSLDALSLSRGTATATISSGEIVPVAEPASLLLLGSAGLVGLGAAVRRRLGLTT